MLKSLSGCVRYYVFYYYFANVNLERKLKCSSILMFMNFRVLCWFFTFSLFIATNRIKTFTVQIKEDEKKKQGEADNM